MNLKRRHFLGISCSVASFLYSCGRGRNILDPRVENITWHESKEEFISSVCSSCRGGCGITVRVVDGKPVFIEGNRSSPINRGKLCPKGSGSVWAQYSKKRYKNPMVRSGRGENSTLKEISWHEALTLLQNKLKEKKKEKKAHSLMMLSGAQEGSIKQLFKRFFDAYGSPNYYQIYDSSIINSTIYSQMAFGKAVECDYDFKNSTYILSFGAHLFEHFGSAVYNMRMIKGKRDEKNPELVQVEPVASLAGLSADQSIQIKPGTYNFFALGILSVILQEGRYNKSFVKRYATNFNAFYEMVVQNFYPSKVSGITGISKNTIIRLARDFATSKRPVAVAGDNLSSFTNEFSSYSAIFALNFCMGTIDKPGGVLIKRGHNFYVWPEDRNKKKEKKAPSRNSEKEDTHKIIKEVKKSIKTFSGPRLYSPYLTGYEDYFVSDMLSRHLNEGKPYKAEIAFLYNCGQLFSHPDYINLTKSLHHIPFIVSFASLPSFESEIADLILPNNTGLEQFEDVEMSVSTHKVFALRQPSSPPSGTKNTGDVILELARGVGEDMAKKFPWENCSGLIQEKAEALYTSKRGHVLSDEVREAFLDMFRNDGYHYEQHSDFDSFYEDLKKSGGWQEPIYFYEDYNRIFLKKVDLLLGNDVSFFGKMPTFAGDIGKFPLVLNLSYPVTYSFNGHGVNMNGYGIRNLRHNETGSFWAEINTHTAKHYHINNRDKIKIFTKKGSIEMKVSVNENIHPDVINIDLPGGDPLFDKESSAFVKDIFSLCDHNITQNFTSSIASGSTRASIKKV